MFERMGGFHSGLLKSMIDREPYDLPRVLGADEERSRLTGLEKFFPFTAVPQHQLQNNDSVGQQTGDIMKGIFGL